MAIRHCAPSHLSRERSDLVGVHLQASKIVHQVNMLTIKFNDLNLIPRSHEAEGELAPENCSQPSRCAACWVHRSKEGREETL